MTSVPPRPANKAPTLGYLLGSGRRAGTGLNGAPVGDAPLDDSAAGQPAPGQPAPGQPTPGQPAPGQPTPGQPAPGQPAPGESGPGDPGPGDPGPGDPASGGRRVWRLVAFAVVVLLAAGGGLVAYALAGDIARGTRVDGVDIGGMSLARARWTVGRELGPRTGAPVVVSLDGNTFEVSPGEAGLVLDVAATVSQASRGGRWAPGRRQVPPVIRVDVEKLATVLRGRLGRDTLMMRQPGISYVGLTPRPTYPVEGRDIDPTAAAELIRAGWLGDATVTVPVVRRAPETTREQVDALLAGVAVPAVAKPVLVTVAGTSFLLTPQMIAGCLVFRADAQGWLAPSVDPQKLAAVARTQLAAVQTVPVDARFDLSGAAPTIVAGRPGNLVDLDALADDVLAVLPSVGINRRVTATLHRQEPATTEQEAGQLGVREQVSTFTTGFPEGPDSPRAHDLAKIAQEVDGALVKPGETFSLNGHTGPRAYDRGAQDAPAIVDGKLQPGPSGATSQFATTLFNAAYSAGLTDVEHQPHAVAFDRYPAVIESTVSYPDRDLKFRNDTPYGVVIAAASTPDSVTVSMWSTKYVDTLTERGPRRDLSAPPIRYREPGPRCTPVDGLPGFAQDVYRIVRRGGTEVQREKFTWRYQPAPRVVCGRQPS